MVRNVSQKVKSSFSFEAFGISDVGLVREQNEDAWQAISEKGIFILADGMGGHQSGEVASKMAVEGLAVLLKKEKMASKVLEGAISKLNLEVFKKSLSEKGLHGMGTTLVCLACTEETAFYAHVGDSRLYLMRDKRLKLLTEDHTLINELIALGTIDQDEKKSSLKHILTRAVGTQDTVETTLGSIDLKKGDLFLLCSDGLTNFASDKFIEEILSQNISLENRGKQLVELAKINGGGDNITLILVLVKQNDLSR